MKSACSPRQSPRATGPASARPWGLPRQTLEAAQRRLGQRAARARPWSMCCGAPAMKAGAIARQRPGAGLHKGDAAQGADARPLTGTVQAAPTLRPMPVGQARAAAFVHCVFRPASPAPTASLPSASLPARGRRVGRRGDKRDFGNCCMRCCSPFTKTCATSRPTTRAQRPHGRRCRGRDAPAAPARRRLLPCRLGATARRLPALAGRVRRATQGAMFRQAEVKAASPGRPGADRHHRPHRRRLQHGRAHGAGIDYKTESHSVTRQSASKAGGRTQLPFTPPCCTDAPRAAYVNLAGAASCTNDNWPSGCEASRHDMAASPRASPARAGRGATSVVSSARISGAALGRLQKTIGQTPVARPFPAPETQRQWPPRTTNPYEHNGQPCLARGLLRHCLRPAPQRGGGGLRGRGARPGCWSRACCGRCSTAAPPHEILAITFTKRPRARCASACRVAGAVQPQTAR